MKSAPQREPVFLGASTGLSSTALPLASTGFVSTGAFGLGDSDVNKVAGFAAFIAVSGAGAPSPNVYVISATWFKSSDPNFETSKSPSSSSPNMNVGSSISSESSPPNVYFGSSPAIVADASTLIASPLLCGGGSLNENVGAPPSKSGVVLGAADFVGIEGGGSSGSAPGPSSIVLTALAIIECTCDLISIG